MGDSSPRVTGAYGRMQTDRNEYDEEDEEELSAEEAAAIPASRWDAIRPDHKQHAAGGRKVAWLMAFEKLCGRMRSTGGGFVYKLEDAQGEISHVFFPLLTE